jgi:hypothetical protein
MHVEMKVWQSGKLLLEGEMETNLTPEELFQLEMLLNESGKVRVWMKMVEEPRSKRVEKAMEPDARRILNKYSKRLRRLELKVMTGNTDAALKMIQTMTEFETEMSNLGYRLDSTEGWTKRVVRIGEKSEKKPEELVSGALQGDMNAMREYLDMLEGA